jgi:hypothetical protein
MQTACNKISSGLFLTTKVCKPDSCYFTMDAPRAVDLTARLDIMIVFIDEEKGA